MKSHTQSGYNMAQPYSGVVNNANSSYMQQQPPMTNLVALGGSMHNYSSQTMYSQPQTLFTQNQTCYPQPTIHNFQPQNYTMQGPRY